MAAAGLKVIMRWDPYDAKGRMLAAIGDDNVVVVIHNELSLGISAPVPKRPI
jgi:pyruvate/2-oxoglutarate/acetoin dehydrogenase E1 component